MKETVAVIYGGPSTESEVSRRSAENVQSALVKLGYEATMVELNPKIGAILLGLSPSRAFVITHGNPGEDGSVQGLLEVMKIPYTYSGILASALALDKRRAKEIMAGAGVPVLKDLLLDREELANGQRPDIVGWITREFGMPVIVKPVREGSSIGVTKVSEAEGLKSVISQSVGRFGRVLIEPFITGLELTAGILEDKGVCTALPLQELRPRKEFYDFEAKYTEGMTDFVIPARIPEETGKRIQETAVRAFKALGCEGAGRVDFILQDGKFWVLEVNTIPGMTDTSDLPAEARAAGIEFPQLVERILNSARLGK